MKCNINKIWYVGTKSEQPHDSYCFGQWDDRWHHSDHADIVSEIGDGTDWSNLHNSWNVLILLMSAVFEASTQL